MDSRSSTRGGARDRSPVQNDRSPDADLLERLPPTRRGRDILDLTDYSRGHAGRVAMPELPPVTIVNVGYRSTNFWVVSAGTSRLLVDLGYPGTMGTLRANLNRMGVPFGEIRYGLATHYHYDHAGLAQELKHAGVPLLVLEPQVAAIPLLKRVMKPQDRYVDITTHDNVTISFAESRPRLARIGIGGEIVHTPGHSDDSVSLLLDDGSAFTGDLTHPALVGEEDSWVVADSWRRLRERGAVRVYPGHGPVRPMHAERTT
jgi:glyoxylase-like metal-dependent hydrolase (beta-lactamase superfamily II)